MLTRLLKFVSLLLAFWSLCSCSANAGYQNVRSSTERFSIEGVSLYPPKGEGWEFKKNHPGSLQFGKYGERKDQTIGAFVSLSKLPAIETEEEFFKLVSEQRGRGTPNPRHETVLNSEKLSDERDDFCVRFHTIYKDFKAKNLPDNAKYLIVEDIGTNCRHPYNKNIAVTIALSQRTLSDNKIEDFESLANDFIKGVTFIPFSKTNREIGLDYMKNNQFELAIKHLNMAISEDPGDEKNFNSRGSAFEKSSDYTNALKDFNTALKLNPDFATAYYNRGVVYSRLSEYSLALKDFNKAIELNPKDGWSYYNRAHIYQLQFKYSQAIHDLYEVIELNPGLPMAHNNIAWIYATCKIESLRDGDKAVYHALKAVEMKANPANLDTLGAAYVANKQFEEALDAYNQVIGYDRSFIKRYQNSLKEKGCYSGPVNGVSNSAFEKGLKDCISKGNYL